jgi:hypothetical protein
MLWIERMDQTAQFQDIWAQLAAAQELLADFAPWPGTSEQD